MKNIFATLILLGLLPVAARAQFTFTTNSGAITITGYNIAAGLNVIIPASTNGYPVTAIGANAFYYLADITNVTISGNVISIGDSAFQNCSGLRSVTIPNSVTSIGNQVFEDCSGLQGVTIPDSVTSIGHDVFDSCSSLTSVTIPGSITNISASAFYSCYGLTNVTIPNSVTLIDSYAFDNCTNLPGVTIPNSVTSIGFLTFGYCYALTNVTIPGSVNSMGSYVFYNCTNLHQAYFQGNAPLVNGGAGSLDTSVFGGETGTVFYVANTAGWGSTFGGWTTMTEVYPPQPQLLAASLKNNQFKFTIFWMTNASVVVQVSTNLTSWSSLVTNTLVSGTNDFTDATWTNYSQRFYRVQTQ